MLAISLKITILMPRMWASHCDLDVCFAVIAFACKDKKRSLKQVEAAHCTYTKLCRFNKSFFQRLYKCLLYLSHSLADQSGYLLCGFCPLQRCVGDIVSGALEEARGRAGLQVGNPGHPRRVFGGAQATVQGKDCYWSWSVWMKNQCCVQHLSITLTPTC